MEITDYVDFKTALALKKRDLISHAIATTAEMAQ